MQVSTDGPYGPKQIREHIAARESGAPPLRPNTSQGKAEVARRTGRPRKHRTAEDRTEAIRAQKLNWWRGSRQVVAD